MYVPYPTNIFPVTTMLPQPALSEPTTSDRPSRYESQKRRDWATFGLYLRNHRPPLTLSRCSAAHVLEFLRYLDQFGKTKVHLVTCPYFGHPHPPLPCQCPLKQAWGSLDALVGRLRAAFEENGGLPEVNPFGVRAVRLYLRGVRDTQAKARGIAYEKKKKRRRQKGTDAASMNGGGEEKRVEENDGMGGGQFGNFTSEVVSEGYGGVVGYLDVYEMIDGFIPLSVFD